MKQFNALEYSCCNIGVREKMIGEYLLDGLRPSGRMILDATAGGTVMNLTARQV